MKGEQLFLMEFLVEKVNIPAIRAIHEEILPARTCISFQVQKKKVSMFKSLDSCLLTC